MHTTTNRYPASSSEKSPDSPVVCIWSLVSGQGLVCILVCGWIILGKHWDWDTGWTMNVNTGQQGSNTFIFIPHHIVLHCFSLIGMNLIVWTMERLYHVTIALFDGLQTNLLQCARRQPPDDPKPKQHFSCRLSALWLGRIWWKILTLDGTTKNYF